MGFNCFNQALRLIRLPALPGNLESFMGLKLKKNSTDPSQVETNLPEQS